MDRWDVIHPWGRQPSKTPKLRARFVPGEYGRYADIEGTTYPVILSSYLENNYYEEPVTEEYREWFRRFFDEIRERGNVVILANDEAFATKGRSSEKDWRFKALHRVTQLKVADTFSLMKGDLVAKLESKP